MDDFLIDTHAHLDMIKKKQPSKVVEDALKNKVEAIINVGSSIAGSRQSVFFAKEFINVFATVGVHPHDASSFGKSEKKVLMELISEDTKIDKDNRESDLKKQIIVAIELSNISAPRKKWKISSGGILCDHIQIDIKKQWCTSFTCKSIILYFYTVRKKDLMKFLEIT